GLGTHRGARQSTRLQEDALRIRLRAGHVRRRPDRRQVPEMDRTRRPPGDRPPRRETRGIGRLRAGRLNPAQPAIARHPFPRTARGAPASPPPPRGRSPPPRPPCWRGKSCFSPPRRGGGGCRAARGGGASAPLPPPAGEAPRRGEGGGCCVRGASAL